MFCWFSMLPNSGQLYNRHELAVYRLEARIAGRRLDLESVRNTDLKPRRKFELLARFQLSVESDDIGLTQKSHLWSLGLCFCI